MPPLPNGNDLGNTPHSKPAVPTVTCGLKSARWLLLLFCIEGLSALVWTFLTPSESGRAVFLWLSRERILLLLCTFVIWAGILTTTVYLRLSTPLLERLLERLDRRCLDQERLGALLLLLFVVPLLIAAAVLAIALTPLEFAVYGSWAPDTFPLLYSLIVGILPLLVFLLSMAVEVGVYLALRYRTAIAAPQTWSWAWLAPTLLALIIVAAAFFQWAILAFQLRFFVNIPAWYWKFHVIPFTWRDLWFSLGVLILVALAYWLLILRRQVVAGLWLVVLLGCFLQAGPGIMASGGFSSLAGRYFSSYHGVYVLKASQSHTGILASIQRYEALYGTNVFTSTKPPGLMAFYIGLEHLVNGNPPAYADDVRYARLAQVITFGFPVFAMAMVFVVSAFARRFFQGTPGLVRDTASLLYVLCPNVILFSLFPDQAIYPLVFLIGVWFTVVAVRRESVVWAFLLGIFLYASVFFAFVMLPLYPFAGLYLVLHYWTNRSDQRWSQPLKAAIAIAGGTLSLYVVCLTFLNYDFFPRFARTMAINHNFDFYLRVGLRPPSGPESLATRLSQIVHAAWINNLDFAAGIGFPIYILFVVQGFRLLKRSLIARPAAADTLLASLVLSFIVLSLAGTAQGEVPRLWLFWLPMVVILASMEIEPYLQERPFILLWLALMQYVTILLTYHFQDLRM